MALDLISALEEAREEEERARSELERVTERLRLVEIERRGLELALARHKPQESTLKVEAVSEAEAQEWRGLTRNAALIRVMQEENRPLGPTELSRLLRARGRKNDSLHYVSAALAYLKRRGNADNPTQGNWVLTEAANEDASVVHLFEGVAPRT